MNAKSREILRAENIFKSYGNGEAKTQVLKGLVLHLRKGKCIQFLASLVVESPLL